MESKEKKYDLEERTLRFAKRIRTFCKRLPHSISNNEDIKQLVRASGSVGANYIEANESISKKDFLFRIKICRKEAKECRYFLNLVDTENILDLEKERNQLHQEANEIMKIFGSIVTKSEN